ncbi:50S ribosomal protein L10 [Enterobacteriaceae endosymbiont of Plateumaris consimilis]|uniref:50S ribosomal protein L10 n=1 Tax=Enterobacteriaceae endosymbiont of Plateumaris consimilis TaxID=2675794 RepID=UPI001449AD88|nr:50S ribosomal protein L10 [Enterobacteriaceae endosymbiont of Plateumaris consimilis]QJC28723.1 50S ribosomal protein L10 [Enterobacteriaceae endosymbiont of Plateumaris consimilis]
MPLNITEKKMIVAKLSKINQKALSVVIANSCGINVNSITELRKNSRENNVFIGVVKNKLLKLIIKNSTFECLKDQLHGPILIGYSLKHPGSAARLFKEFAKKNTNFKIKIASFNGKLIDAKDIDRLATLPTYKEALSFMLATIKEAAIGKFIKILVIIKNIKK